MNFKCLPVIDLYLGMPDLVSHRNSRHVDTASNQCGGQNFVILGFHNSQIILDYLERACKMAGDNRRSWLFVLLVVVHPSQIVILS